jgi:hypothetical protein
MTEQKIRLSSIETEKPESEEFVVEISEDDQKVNNPRIIVITKQQKPLNMITENDHHNVFSK